MARRKRSPKFTDPSAADGSEPTIEEPASPAPVPEASSADPTTALTNPAAPATPSAAADGGDAPAGRGRGEATAAVQGNGKSNGSGNGDGQGPAETDGGDGASPATDPQPADASTQVVTQVVPDVVEVDELPAPSGDGGGADAGATDDGAPAHAPGSARQARQRAIRTALATLPVPNPEPGFWAGLDVALAEQKPLAISARPAIRPITEPPPLSQPRPGDNQPDPAMHLSSRSAPRDGKDLMSDRSGRRKLLLVIGGFVVLLLVVGSTLADDGSGGTPDTSSSSSTIPGEVTTTQPGATTSTTVPQIRGLEPDTVMTPIGVGPLRIGSRLGDIDSQGVDRTVDPSTFEGSDGTCFDVRLPGMGDLTLRYRSPDPARGVTDPREGVLASISISTQVGSVRGTEAAMGLRAPVEAVRDAHAGNIDVIDDPYLPGGEIYLVPATDGSGNGLAYRTDGSVVTAISVGALDVISSPQPCI